MITLDVPSMMYESLQAHYGRLVSVSLPCPGITPEQFLQEAGARERFYWQSHQDETTLAGIGAALEITGYGPDRFHTIQSRVLELFAEAAMLTKAPAWAGPRLFGGFAFNESFMPDYAWAGYAPAHFVLPHYQYTRHEGTAWMTINAHIPYGEAPGDLRSDLESALREQITFMQSIARRPASPLSLQEMRYPMSATQWRDMIEAALAKIQAGAIKKVVLARVCELLFHEPVDPAYLLEALGQAYPQTYRFLFEPRPHHAFYGATPELLVSVSGRQLHTMALAGSAKRGRDKAEDHVIAEAELLNNPKNRFEHDLVIQGILKRLQPLTTTLTMSETGLLKLSNIQHLHTAVSAIMRKPEGVLSVAAILHPTPALGGEPTDAATRFIVEQEPVPRGWYAAPVGWVDANGDGQFAVAIRSAVAQERRVWLYAGAGIVAGSDPQSEWDETALKFRPMLQALGI